MYNNNGNSYGGGPYRRGSGIPPIYLYIGIGILLLLGIWLLMGFLRAGIDAYFALVVGILLVLGNLRDLIASPFQGRGQVSLMNTLLGASLGFFFLGRGRAGDHSDADRGAADAWPRGCVHRLCQHRPQGDRHSEERGWEQN